MDTDRMLWRKSSHSTVTNCLEAASGNGFVYIRDSKNRSTSQLAFSARAWQDFISDLPQRRE